MSQATVSTSVGREPRPRTRLSPVALAFVGCVIVPTLLAGAYLYALASDRYVSEAHFMVRSVSGRHVGGLASLFRTFGIARAEDDAFAVHSFILSRDALRELDKRLDLKAMFQASAIDRLSRFPRPWRTAGEESLFDFYLDRVGVIYNAAQGISTLRVTAWRPEDARRIAETLLELSEELINRMNQRSNSDSLQHAERERARAEEMVLSTQKAITQFRNREMLLDPSLASLKALDLIAKLSSELAQARTQLAELAATSPGSPAVRSLQARTAALQDQITSERAKIVGDDRALAQKVTEYERLAMEREFADRNLATTSGALELARQEARRQHIYIETVVAPHQADESVEPKRLRLLASTMVVGFAIFSMLWLVVSGAREHAHG